MVDCLDNGRNAAKVSADKDKIERQRKDRGI
jgi:hypothetical protein